MKDQNTIPDGETKQDKWNRGLDIFIESVIEPDPALRACAVSYTHLTLPTILRV